MTFLPIVERELRSASHRRSTFRVRWWVALLALLLSLFALGASSRARGGGSPIFNILTGYAFGCCLLAGIFLTADSLAEEKRDGTLGLLFLTDLKGYDVVLGKFMAHSLNAAYALLALVPATALPLLVGGVNGGEFWRMTLALGNALFFSLAAGICVSAFSRDAQRAMGNTLGLLILNVGILPVGLTMAKAAGLPLAWQTLAWATPLTAFARSADLAYARAPGTFWAALGVSHLLGWALLGLASAYLPRAVQDRPGRSLKFKIRNSKELAIRNSTKLEIPDSKSGRSNTAPDGELHGRDRRSRRALLNENPVIWLRHSELKSPWLAWIVVLAWGIVVGAITVMGITESATMLTHWAHVFGFLVKLFFAMEACRFFVQARREGTLELLLCTPLSDHQIVRGQMQALWRNYAGPFIALAALTFVPPTARMVMALVGRDLGPMTGALGGYFLAGVFTVQVAADVLAILYFGTAIALTGKRPGLAPAWTILFVLVLPGPVAFCWLDILVNLVLISWGNNKCQVNLRRLAAQQYQVVSSQPAFAGSSALGVPPRIA